jgi:hypothetical protein
VRMLLLLAVTARRPLRWILPRETEDGLTWQ